jgi:hypothetical protein
MVLQALKRFSDFNCFLIKKTVAVIAKHLSNCRIFTEFQTLKLFYVTPAQTHFFIISLTFATTKAFFKN